MDVNGNITVQVKKEKDLPVTELDESLPKLPSLDSLPGQEENEENHDIIHTEKSNETEEPAPKKIKCADFEEWFDDVCVTGVSVQSVNSLVEQEVARYLASNRHADDSKLSLLEWWKKYEYSYPRLSVLAKKYLAIPASSVPSERVFSLAGNIVNKKRSRLNPRYGRFIDIYENEYGILLVDSYDIHCHHWTGRKF